MGIKSRLPFLLIQNDVFHIQVILVYTLVTSRYLCNSLGVRLYRSVGDASGPLAKHIYIKAGW